MYEKDQRNDIPVEVEFFAVSELATILLYLWTAKQNIDKRSDWYKSSSELEGHLAEEEGLPEGVNGMEG